MQWLTKITSFFEQKEARHEYLLALIFKEKGIKAVIWEEKEGQATIVDTSETSGKINIEELPDEELIALVDQAIGIAEKNLPPNIKTTKTIFAVRDFWARDNAINEPYLSKIKKISKELELSPLGFLVITEAIVHQLRKLEGTPPTVLLISIGEEVVSVSLVRAGRIEVSKTEKKEDKSASEKASQVIRSFGEVEILPSRMILFDGEVALEEARQEFLSYQWTKDLPFLHFPKIDILKEGEDAKAVVGGAASEMGLSFEESKTPKEAEEAIEEEGEIVKREAFGFIKERDILEDVLPKEERLEEPEPAQKPSEAPATQAPRLQSLKIKLPTINLLPILTLTKESARALKSLRPPKFGNLWVGFLVSILLIFSALALSLFFFPKATITLVAQARTLENDVEVTIDPNASSVDKKKRVIPSGSAETTQETQQEKVTTGKKTVGDRAKGEVTIYNKTENKKTFAKGTVLLGPGDLRFTLDGEVTLASTPAFEITPSSVKAKVTAGQIGEGSNLASNTNFPFKDFPTSSYFAKNEAPFTGGTKREVTVVSKEDQETLLKAALDELRNKAKDELSTKAAGSRIVDIALEEDIVSREYSKKVDEEADTVSLKLAVSFRAQTFRETDLLEIVGSEIEKGVPQGFSFQKDKFETVVRGSKKEKGGATSLTIHYKATLLPALDTKRIRDDVAGKRRTAVERYLESLPLESFTMSQNIELPYPLNLLPIKAENIKVEIKAK